MYFKRLIKLLIFHASSKIAFIFRTTARRKPGPKPRRVPQNSVPVPASPSPSLAQLFAAADSPQRPSSGSEESESASTTHHKDGRPRNLGRGVSKPKKNTVASLLAQSRALGIKPTPTLDPSVPLSHQVSLLRSNILAAQLHATATGQGDDKNQVKFVFDTILFNLKMVLFNGVGESLNSKSDGIFSIYSILYSVLFHLQI